MEQKAEIKEMVPCVEMTAIILFCLQDFVVRNDSPCGSTIGPIMSAKLGMQTIDIGAPQLSMHSIREMGDTTSIVQCTDLYRVTANFFFYH